MQIGGRPASRPVSIARRPGPISKRMHSWSWPTRWSPASRAAERLQGVTLGWRSKHSRAEGAMWPAGPLDMRSHRRFSSKVVARWRSDICPHFPRHGIAKLRLGQVLSLMVRLGGLEPPTSGATNLRSNQLSYNRISRAGAHLGSNTRTSKRFQVQSDRALQKVWAPELLRRPDFSH